MSINYVLCSHIGQLPMEDGLFGRPGSAYFSTLQLSLTPLQSEWSSWCHDRGYAPRVRRAPRAKVACHLVRILPAEDRGDGTQSVGDHQASRAARAQLRVRYLRLRSISSVFGGKNSNERWN